jgi:hypothetical protein
MLMAGVPFDSDGDYLVPDWSVYTLPAAADARST